MKGKSRRKRRKGSTPTRPVSRPNRKEKAVHVVEWEEHEPDFGPRNDGWSVHVSQEAMEAFIRKINSQPAADDCFSLPARTFVVHNNKLYALARSQGGSAWTQTRPENPSAKTRGDHQ